MNRFSSSANELVNSLHSKNSKSYWSSVKLTVHLTPPPSPLFDGSTGELVYEDMAKADLLNQCLCSIT